MAGGEVVDKFQDQDKCCVCGKQPRLGGGTQCPWCQHGPHPHLWPSYVRATVRRQGNYDLEPGQVPPSDRATNAKEVLDLAVPLMMLQDSCYLSDTERARMFRERNHQAHEFRANYRSPWDPR